MKTKYQIDGFLKFAEEDVYSEGCIPNTATSYEVPVSFTGKTPDEVIQKAADYLGVKTNGEDNGVEKNACDETGRVDFALLECDDSTQPSAGELVAWKKGRIRLWNCVYTGYVEKVSQVRL